MKNIFPLLTIIFLTVSIFFALYAKVLKLDVDRLKEENNVLVKINNERYTYRSFDNSPKNDVCTVKKDTVSLVKNIRDVVENVCGGKNVSNCEWEGFSYKELDHIHDTINNINCK